MEPRFQLRCLGEPVLLGPDGQPVRFKVRKHLALLVYLAVESGSRHRREHLAELLWPNLPDAEGRHSLATALSTLRARFGRDVVEAGRDDLRWSHTRLDVDLDRLAAGNVLGDEYTTPLDVAGFLDGFEVPGAAEFMLWRERQRARWLPLVRDALVVLMDRCRRTGDSRQIEQLADRMLRLDDLSEDAVRAKMEARAFAGDRLSALKIFEAWKERLDEELGASPSALLEGMALRLRRRGWERSGASEIPSVRTDQWKNRPFVGRANEYRTLYEGWERAQRGGAGHALVVGESGIGKSTLVERLTTAAGLEGASVARVQCYELEREIPYAAVCGLVRGLLDRPGASGTSPSALAELSRVDGEVRRRFPSLPEVADSAGEAARIRLADAFHQLVSAVADEHPAILVLDDHHLADDASLGILHLLVRRLRGEPVQLILITRENEIAQAARATSLAASLARLGASTVQLPALTHQECDELLNGLIPPEKAQPNGAIRRALVKAASGLPMVLELLCLDWIAHGEQSLALSLDAMTQDPSASLGPAEAYRQLYARIVQSLDPVTRNVLNLASILHHRLNDVSMYGLVDLTIGQTMAGMSLLTDIRVLRDGGAGVEFVNELIRAHAYMNVPSAVRRALHSHIADRLKHQEREGMEVQGLEVAWHCIRGGRLDEGIPYLLKGARQAIQHGAPQEAERGLTTGLPILHGSARAEGILLLTECLQEQGDWAGSVSLLESSATDLSEAVADDVLTLRLLAHARLGMIGPDNAPQAVQQLERIATTANSVRVRSRALFASLMMIQDGKLQHRCTSLIEIGQSLENERVDDSIRLELSLALGALYGLIGDRVQSIAALTRGLNLIEERRYQSATAATVVNALGAAHCASGEYSTALTLFTRAYEMRNRLGNDAGRAVAAANAALCCGRLGNSRDQLEWANRSAKVLGPEFAGYQDIQVGTYQALAHARMGQPTRALAAIQWLDERVPASAHAWLRQGWHLYKADVLMTIGRKSAALAEARQGTSGEHHELHARGFAGPFARWVSLTTDSRGTKPALERVRGLMSKLDSFDEVDQVEILGAVLGLIGERTEDRYCIELAETCRNGIAERVKRLPPATASQLAALGTWTPGS